jgi:hypothetical protein
MLVLTLSLALGATACTGEGDDPGGPAQPGSSAAATDGASHGVADVATTATIGKVTGRLGHGRREHLKKKVAGVVDRWLDAAYVSGDYPRSGFPDAFPGFTKGAEADARKDLGLMSNAVIGNKVDKVEARNRRLRIDVLAVRRKAVGVTARFVLDFDMKGKLTRSERVKGQLYMTWHHDRGWKVFGYHVSRGVRR